MAIAKHYDKIDFIYRCNIDCSKWKRYRYNRTEVFSDGTALTSRLISSAVILRRNRLNIMQFFLFHRNPFSLPLII